MKKMVMASLFIALLGIFPISAETWAQYIRRAETQFHNTQAGLQRGHHSTWSIDKWGALSASLDWLEQAYENIYRSAPNLTAEERRIYGRIFRQRAQAFYDFQRLMIIVHGRNRNTLNRIGTRESYWFRHLNNGGTITFN